MYFDTLTVTENLITAGMPDGQAKAIAREYANFMQHQVDQFATKEDIKLLRSDLHHVNDDLRNELQHARGELKHVNDELRSELQHIRNELRHVEECLDTKFDGLMWRMMVNIWGIAAIVAGLLFAAIRLF
jgi:DNA anti-recombination protein RmuC